MKSAHCVLYCVRIIKNKYISEVLNKTFMHLRKHACLLNSLGFILYPLPKLRCLKSAHTFNSHGLCKQSSYSIYIYIRSCTLPFFSFFPGVETEAARQYYSSASIGSQVLLIQPVFQDRGFLIGERRSK